MLDDKDLEIAVQELIMDICEVMYRRGYDQVCIGHIMRLVGVPEQRAQTHDKDFFALDAEFQTMLDQKTNQQKKSPKKENKASIHTPDGVTIH